MRLHPAARRRVRMMMVALRVYSIRVRYLNRRIKSFRTCFTGISNTIINMMTSDDNAATAAAAFCQQVHVAEQLSGSESD
eukprot:9482739-Pyramimonas_sp.AAC.1